MGGTFTTIFRGSKSYIRLSQVFRLVLEARPVCVTMHNCILYTSLVYKSLEYSLCIRDGHCVGESQLATDSVGSCLAELAVTHCPPQLGLEYLHSATGHRGGAVFIHQANLASVRIGPQFSGICMDQKVGYMKNSYISQNNNLISNLISLH